jgi:NTP pyrophosphatase (non-canonical NTP hydrolase)
MTDGDRVALSAEPTVREISAWAGMQAKRLAAGYDLDAGTDLFLLAQTAKLGEEVGELHAEVLGRAGYHHRSKDGAYNRETLAGELADVAICVAILAEVLDTDLSEALTRKIAKLERRYGSTD